MAQMELKELNKAKNMWPTFRKQFICIIACGLLVTSCMSSKIVLARDVNISKYKYVVFGRDTSGNKELEDIIMSVQNRIAETSLTVLSASNTLKILACSDSILTTNIYVSSEKWDGGHTYITVTFCDYNNGERVAVVKSSGIGLTIGHDQSIALSALGDKLNELFN